MSHQKRANGKLELELYEYENANPMSHSEALEINAVEFYVRKELTPEQELRFEEHYFECQECACAVAVEQALRAKTSGHKAAEPWWRRLALPVLAPATAVLLGFAGFQGLELAKLSGPHANTVILAMEDEKGEAEKGKPVSTPSVTIERRLPVDSPQFPFYDLVISREGKTLFSQVLPAPENSRLSIQVLSRELGTGSFRVVVYGRTREDAKDGPQIGGQSHFKLQ